MSSGGGEKDPLVRKDAGSSAGSSENTALTRHDSKSFYFAPLKSRQNTMVCM